MVCLPDTLFVPNPQVEIFLPTVEDSSGQFDLIRKAVAEASSAVLWKRIELEDGVWAYEYGTDNFVVKVVPKSDRSKTKWPGTYVHVSTDGRLKGVTYREVDGKCEFFEEGIAQSFRMIGTAFLS